MGKEILCTLGKRVNNGALVCLQWCAQLLQSIHMHVHIPAI